MARSLAFHTDLALRRHEGSAIQRGVNMTVVTSPHNPGFYWGNFLLMDSPPRAGDLSRWESAFGASLPGAVHRVFGIDTPGGDLGAAEEFREAGYQLLSDTVLTTTRAQPPRRLNRDVIIRTLQTDPDWSAALAMRLAVNASDPAGFQEASYRDFAARKLESYRRAQGAGYGAMLGAFDEAGQMLCGLGIFDAGDGVARYQNVETHPAYRSQGLAGTLVYRAGEWAREKLGTRTLVIVADPAYHAQKLYESVGFRPTERQVALERRPERA